MPLLLPRSQLAPVAVPPLLDLNTTAQRRAFKGSILLVEDDDEVAVLVKRCCRNRAQAIRAASAQGAFGALADGREMQLVYSGVMMPGTMNGTDLAQEIERRRPAMPVLLTTGYASGTLRNTDAHAISILHKPYELPALDSALRAAIAGPARL